MGGPDPGPGEAEHRGEDGVPAVLLAEQDDVGVEDEGHKLVGGAMEGGVDGWQENGMVG